MLDTNFEQKAPVIWWPIVKDFTGSSTPHYTNDRAENSQNASKLSSYYAQAYYIEQRKKLKYLHSVDLN